MSFEWALTNVADPMQGPWKVQVAGGLFDLSFSAIMLFAYGFSLYLLEHKPIPLTQFLSERLSPMAAEGLLAIAKILMFSLLLIIPGIVYYIFCTFLPYVVFYDGRLLNGDIRALNESKRLVKKHFFKIFGLVVLTGFLSVVIELLPKILGTTVWWLEIWFSLLSFYFGGFLFMFFYGLYEKYKGEN